MTTTLLLLVAGLALLVLGGEFLVRGAVRVAAGLGVSPLVIGLTLVGFGTSAPELVTSVQAALAGSPAIAFGNIVGSNIANLLLIGGISALVFPIAVASGTLARDGLVMLGAACLFAALSAVMPMGRLVGLAFVVMLAGYIYVAFRSERAGQGDGHGGVQDKSTALQQADPALSVPENTPAAPATPMLLPLLTALGGLVLVVLGGKLLVDGAVDLARALAISETVIGLTIVAVGTSMPELVTSVMAALRRQSDVAFGNIVGSNIYNILGIGGATALIAPSQVPETLVSFDNLVMIGVSLVFVAVAWTGLRIARWEGSVLLAGYAVYVWWIWPV